MERLSLSLLLAIAFYFYIYTSHVVSSEVLERSYFARKTDEELSTYLAERGIPCVACLRGQLISLAHESQHLPLIKYKPVEEEPKRKANLQSINPSDPNFDTFVEKMTDKDMFRRHSNILEDLKKQGFDVSAVEKPKDEMNTLIQKARDLREKNDSERMKREKKLREERRKKREERKRRALERAAARRKELEAQKSAQETQQKDEQSDASPQGKKNEL